MEACKSSPEKILLELEDCGPFSPLWHARLRAMPAAMLEECIEACGDCAARDALGRIARLLLGSDFEAWEAHFDGFDGAFIHGWAWPKRGSGAPLRLDCNGKTLIAALHADNFRKDVRDAGFGDGRCGFAIALPNPPLDSNLALFSLVDSSSGKTIGFRFFNLAQVLPEAKTAALAESLAAAGKDLECLSLCKEAAERFPQNAALLKAGLDCAKKLGRSGDADAFLEKLFHIDRAYGMDYALQPLDNNECPSRDALELALKRLYSHAIIPASRGQSIRIKSVFEQLLDLEDSFILNLIYNNFLQNYLMPAEAMPNAARRVDLLRNRILWVFRALDTLYFMLPVLKRMPAWLVDVYITDNGNFRFLRSEMDRFGLGGHRLLTDKERIRNYGAYLIDIFLYTRNKTVVGMMANKRVVIHTHSVSMMAAPYARPGSLSLVACETLCHAPANIPLKKLSAESRRALDSIPETDKSLIAYTGPYHLGKFLDGSCLDKRELRAELEEELHRRIDYGKPLVFCLQGTIDITGQLLFALGRLSKSCTIIFKTAFNNADERLKRLPQDVIIYDSLLQAPSLPRMASDFVLCAAYSGSFLSCLMQGINVIPFYTRIYRYHERKISYGKWSDYFIHNHAKHPLFSRLFKLWPYFFDILDVRKIEEAIFGAEYVSWYSDNKARLQKQVFGGYFLRDADRMTADYMIEYICTGGLAEAEAVHMQ